MLAVSASLISGCYKCTDVTALNNQTGPKKDACRYSQVAFYASSGYYSGIPISKIDVTVNGNAVGTINYIYPNGPGNCSAQGIAKYQFVKGSKVDWNTIVYLANGATPVNSGTVSPSSALDCIKVNVTQ